MTKVFIDGSAGTTGLRINERLSQRNDIELLILPDEIRKDVNARREALNGADIAFLCLPDAAAIEAVSLVSNPNTAIIDTSTAHRTNEIFEYGFPELRGRRERIAKSKRIANPGCHASGFVALVEPLTEAGIISPDARLTCFSITGYSGGGKQMIAGYEDKDRPAHLNAPRQYGLTQNHKHLKEMAKITGLNAFPCFSPIVADFYSGMEVTVPLFKEDLRGTVANIKEIYKERYNSKIVHFNEAPDEEGFMTANAYSDRDDMEISVMGNEDRIILTARFDNLGKGASGSAIQNMNILLGVPEETGLNV
ncbi:MAG: N-acetyl-gamma-glutamyl-phosphate reductase [Ruminococcaceae bacterium]|nr:N-acetyl-gamma-glutamyl-phosphate reductase [Oscillospiraceae bacterium]